jgi:hypothetical protein
MLVARSEWYCSCTQTSTFYKIMVGRGLLSKKVPRGPDLHVEDTFCGVNLNGRQEYFVAIQKYFYSRGCQ